ncbi:hypothetical protein AT727_05750 [Desulfitobacterium hafniense]|uniref:TipAS antibiotic-recognition domain-containing protein n=1 Tax=Desulfitobacterium hafniense TaxID=49338 RepID=A0A0W1JIE0_DESHA|nr:TipAS antibiotic-recognition domain-containing protein [Desulfitobacterium hafniense]KTE91102.1 hypothetical protein AT727_05750 [Desulfitobacterium hafniense]
MQEGALNLKVILLFPISKSFLIISRLIAMMDGPESLADKKAVAAYRELITMWIPCDDTAFRKIGQAYLIHKEALDEKSPGLAEFVSEAIFHVYR